ncbi:MAG: MCE family protein [Alphaproteobacteria bacterium]|nr:MCE family protein [Alphaproteobacteria bacterium]
MNPQIPRRKAVWLGLFVLVATCIAVGGLMATGTLAQALTPRTRVTTTFHDVGGLSKGDAVWYAGVPVGRVERVGLGRDGVEVRLALDSGTVARIPGSVEARVGSDGLIGNPIVVLEPGEAHVHGPLAEGDIVPSRPGTSMDELMEELRATNANVLAITGSVRTVTDRMDAGEGTLGRLAHDDVLYEEVRSTLGSLKVASDEASAMARDGRELARDARDVVATVDAATQGETPLGVLVGDRDAGQDLDATIENLEASSETLSENLAAMRDHWLLGGLFTPKAQKREERQARRAARRDAVDPDDAVAGAE